MEKNLPIYDIVLDDWDAEQGVSIISLVDEPAIGVNWIALSKTNNIHFKADKEKQLLYGPFLIPNKLIYRYDDTNGEYYVRFKSEEIEKISYKFNSDLNTRNITFQHTEERVDGFVAQNWLIETDFDKSKDIGFDLPIGTWFGAIKIKDEDFWHKVVKSDVVKGFSVEILAGLELALKNNILKMAEIKLASAQLEDGTTVYYDGELAVGTAIWMDEAMTQPAPDGGHNLDNNKSIITVDGIVTDIMERVEEQSPSPETNLGLSAEEVSGMIDGRFSELMDEITKLKSVIEQMSTNVNNFNSQFETNLQKFKGEVEGVITEKLSSIPASKSISKPEVKIDEKFSKTIERVRNFAKN